MMHIKAIILSCCAIFLALGLAVAQENQNVIDQTGAEITIPQNPQRVICLAPSVTEIVYALGRSDVVKGATVYSNYPEAAKELPRVGTYIRPDVERIVALEPDLCLGIVEMTPPEVIERLKSFNLPVVLVKSNTLNAVLSSITTLGNVLGASDRAAALVFTLQETMDRMKTTYSNSPKPKVLYQIGNTPMYTACRDTFINELIEIAGGHNVCLSIKGYPQLTREQAVVFMPEVILIPTMGQGEFEAAKEQWQSWPEVPAVRDDRIYILDSDLFDRPGPRIAQGIQQLAKMIHTQSPRAGKASQ
ncbi:ABC transporter substrate-binding protein [Desulfovibrio inopinatus]|uniref:ABC transporter substrate-binding protein n=1 Tax=Desulfovibrio inopinatus TaxID=102109 RepID=UPI00040417CE|nr:cobalamin-binding protein [Desulfovibrio inopinatus]